MTGGRSPYPPRLLEHFRRPRNRGALELPSGSAELANPLCGDRVRLSVRLDLGRIEAATFDGDACAICIASASVLTELVRGLSGEAARRVDEGRVLRELEATVPDARLQCVRLPIQALAAALEHAERSGES